jgi:sugar phosphate isomerase/epimerase
MSLSTLPLSYCTNVHPAQRLDEVIDGLARYTAPVQQRVGRPIAAGLWFAKSVLDELVQPGSPLPVVTSRISELAAALREHQLTCHTLNAFPFGNFHSERVKDQVYLPDWTTSERADYTIGCARVLAELLPEGCDGSISTLPLGFKGHSPGPDFQDRCITRLIEVANAFDALHDDTGKCIRLAIEPEPFCVLETTAETLEFFKRLRAAAETAHAADAVNRHLGVCFDVCHQAVEFEDVTASVAALAKAGIRINKLHITCAVNVETPGDEATRATLAAFAEPRYLHQTFARTKQGIVVRRVDLDRELCEKPPSAFRDAATWRVHFHVPVHHDRFQTLGTTQPELRAALAAVKGLDYAPHLEVETYTWGVLPGGRPVELVDGLTAEMQAVGGWIEELRSGT